MLATFNLVAFPLGVVAAAYGQHSELSRNVLLGLSSSALLVGIALLLAWQWIPDWAIHVLIVTGIISVGVAVWGHQRDELAVAVSTFFVAAGLCAAFYNWFYIIGYLGFSSAICYFALAAERPHLGIPALIIMSIATTVAGLVAVFIRLAGTSFQDALTGLMNRQGYESAIDSAEANRQQHEEAPAVVWLDLDFLENINRISGQLAGDNLLREVASEWSKFTTGRAIFARVGGDEFGVYLPETSLAEAADFVEALRRATPHIAFSCGITSWRHGELASTVHRRASSALYEAKRSGRNCTVHQQGVRTDLTETLREAIHREEIQVHFQPIVDLNNPDVIHGVEALARWTTADGTFIPPDAFIPVAETEGLIQDLGRLVLRQAAGHIATLRNDLGVDVKLFFNMSGLELADPQYAENVLRILDQAGFPARSLVAEITETTLESQSDHAKLVISLLRAHDVKIAIDDFGTGYSSLSRLHTLPVSYLKLDRSFVRDMAAEPDSPLLAVIAAMGATLELPLIAEGVEQPRQADVLRDLGYPYAQGWLYHRAMNIGQLREEMQSAQASRTFCSKNQASQPSG